MMGRLGQIYRLAALGLAGLMLAGCAGGQVASVSEAVPFAPPAVPPPGFFAGTTGVLPAMVFSSEVQPGEDQPPPPETSQFDHREAIGSSQPWQQAYYQVCVEEGYLDEKIQLLYPDEGIPLLGYTRYDDDASEYVMRCWRYRDGKAELCFEGASKPSGFYRAVPPPLYINKKTGNPVSCEYGIVIQEPKWYEVVDGEQIPIDRAVEYNIEITHLQADGDGEIYAPGVMGWARRLIFDWYIPPVPVGAPWWVTALMKYFASDRGLTSQLVMLPPMYPGGAPVLMFMERIETVYYVMTENGMARVTGGKPKGGAAYGSFYIDEAGRGAYVFSGGNPFYGSGYAMEWYSVGPYGFEEMFDEGVGLVRNGEDDEGHLLAFCDGEERLFYPEEGEDVWQQVWEEANEWVERKITEALARRGYVGSPQWLDVHMSYGVPSEDFEDSLLYSLGGRMYSYEGERIWVDWEQHIIEALCDYARLMGQME